jgi:hypothetical protein
MNKTLSENLEDGIFNLVSSIVVTIFALIGNSTVIIILTKPKFQKEPIFRYLIIGTIFDTLYAILVWPSTYPDFFSINRFEITCKIFYYINDITGTFCSWINVLVTIDTLILAKYSSRFKFRENPKCQIIILLIIFLISCLINLADIFYLSLKRDGICAGSSYESSFILNLIFSILSVFIPFSIVILTSCISFHHLKKAQNNINQNDFRKIKRFFRITLGLNLLFFTFNFPIYAVSLILNASRILVPQKIYNLLSFFNYIFPSLDLFIYFTANKRFREKVLSFFKKRNKVSPIV